MAGNAALAKYVSDEIVESDRPLRVCAEAGRKCVRNIHQFPILSPEWVNLVDSLKQLQRLVQLEGRMPVNSKVGEAHGRNTDAEGTLWDQENHENAIRILVEEAKVNLCLRMMNDFKKWQYTPDQRLATLQEAMRCYEFSELQLEQKCRQFEEALGVLLWRAFVHVETLQLMDVPLLIEHTAMVLQHVDTFRKDGLNCTVKEQELIAMYFFASLMRHAEELNNSELLAHSVSCRLVPLAVSHIQNHAANAYPEDFAQEVAAGLAALCYNEDFQTEWPKFFWAPDGSGPDPTEMHNFLQLQDFIDPIIAAGGAEKKRELRPLLDFFNTLKRKLGV